MNDNALKGYSLGEAEIFYSKGKNYESSETDCFFEIISRINKDGQRRSRRTRTLNFKLHRVHPCSAFQKSERRKIMNNELRIFENNEGNSVRTITENGEIWFVAKDIAQALGYSTDGGMNRIFGHVPQIWTGGKRIATRSENGVEQERELLCLTEQGLYFFLGRSDKPAALPYQMWIAGEVAPSIRKTGSYTTSKKTEAKPTHKLIQEAQKIVSAALNCKNEKDYQTTIAFDRIFKDFTGKSALEIAGMKLTKKTELEEYPDGCFWTDEHFEWESDLPSLD